MHWNGRLYTLVNYQMGITNIFMETLSTRFDVIGLNWRKVHIYIYIYTHKQKQIFIDCVCLVERWIMTSK